MADTETDDDTAALDIRCNGCKKRPDQIDDIRESASANRMTPLDYVKVLEPTFNKGNGHFMCTDCYMDAAITDPAWRAP
jgi:hypothetical protein